jgi:hypothetical protein
MLRIESARKPAEKLACCGVALENRDQVNFLSGGSSAPVKEPPG